MRKINKVGIAGAGIMGASIAQVFAQKGYEVILYDLCENALINAKGFIELNQQGLISQGIITEKCAKESHKLVTYTIKLEELANCEFILEAIVEKMSVKHEFWKKVSAMADEKAILVTNTSGLSITEIAIAVKNPERFSGMHWWNPPHIIKLVEIIKGEKTSDSIVEEIVELTKLVDKKPVIVKKDINGFIGNRIQFAVFREALNILEQDAATIEDIDSVLKYGLGFRYATVGPFETADLGGLDTFYNISSYLFEELSDAKKPNEILKKLIDSGNYGVKSKKGFYDYSNGRDAEVIKARDESFLRMIKVINS